MKLWKVCQTVAVTLACAGMVLPPGALAEQGVTSPGVFEVQDVALRPGGLLVGQVVDAQGAGQGGTAVSIHYGAHEVARTTADEQGVFAAQGLRGGQYRIASAEGQRVCRLWADGTAPPAAHPAAILVHDATVARGQWGPAAWSHGHGYGHAWLEWVKAHPYITAGAIVAAIAIPLAFVDRDRRPAS